MKTRTIRVGVFSRRTAPQEGGADTLVTTLSAKLPALGSDGGITLVPVPWQAWSQRRNPVRYAAVRLARRAGLEVPDVDVRGLCRRLALDLAYFTVPAFVQIDIPYIFTLWDLGHRTIPEFPEMRAGRLPWDEREMLCRRMLPRASYVVVGNEAGGKEARNFYGLARERVVAVPFPNPDFSDVVATPVAWLKPGPFFLYPAQGWPHKNHHTLIAALARLRAEGDTATRLVLVGSDQGNVRHLRDTAAAFGVSDRVDFGGFVSRAELKSLYGAATALVFPSLLGPNNLPPQEAAVLGCPAIISDLPGHREQMRSGARYVAPLDADAWATAMRELATDAALRARLIADARAAVAGYTLDAYAGRIEEMIVRLAAVRRLWPAAARGAAV